MIMLKVTKNQGFTLSLEDAFLEKLQGRGQIDTPSPHPHPHPSLASVKLNYIFTLLLLWIFWKNYNTFTVVGQVILNFSNKISMKLRNYIF